MKAQTLKIQELQENDFFFLVDNTSILFQFISPEVKPRICGVMVEDNIFTMPWDTMVTKISVK